MKIISDDESDPKDELTQIIDNLGNSTIYLREKQKEKILSFLNQNDSKMLFICGQPGTGKTSLLLELLGKGDTVSSNFRIYINCMSVNSIEDFYVEVFNYFKKSENLLKNTEILDLPANNKNLRQLFDEINEKVIIVLDEVDYFYQKNKDIIFFELFKIPYLSDCDTRMIMISNNSEFDKEIIPKIEDKKIKIDRIQFAPYTHIEMYEILKNKLDSTKYFQEHALRLIAKKYSNLNGDLRPALEVVKNLLLTNKAKLSEGQKIEMSDALIATNKKVSDFLILLKSLTVEQKLVIASIFNALKNESIELEEVKVKFKK
jgi:Cdc6-like AAA superfamily ATPase